MTNKTTDTEEKENRIKKALARIREVANDIPGATIIYQFPEMKVVFLSDMGLEFLGVRWEEVDGLTLEEFEGRYFNPEHTRDVLPKVLDLLQDKSGNKTISFFHQVRTSRVAEWDWYMMISKVLLRDADGNALLLIGVAMRIDPEDTFTAKAARLLEENLFLRTHYAQFATLTRRERQVLRLTALGKSAQAIADELSISLSTAETHRRNIRRKLHVENNYELFQYASAFDLI